MIRMTVIDLWSRPGKPLKQNDGIKAFCEFFTKFTSTNKIILIAHNGKRFDFPVLVNAIKKNNLTDLLLTGSIRYLDSIDLFSVEMKIGSSPLHGCKNKSLPCLYEHLFKGSFDAHNAEDDVAALKQVLFHSSTYTERNFTEMFVSSGTFLKRMQSSGEIKARKATFSPLSLSNGMKEKLAKRGLDLNTLKTLYTQGGTRVL